MKGDDDSSRNKHKIIDEKEKTNLGITAALVVDVERERVIKHVEVPVVISEQIEVICCRVNELW